MHEGSSITFLDTCLNQDLQDSRIEGFGAGNVSILFYYYLPESGFGGLEDSGKFIHSYHHRHNLSLNNYILNPENS